MPKKGINPDKGDRIDSHDKLLVFMHYRDGECSGTQLDRNVGNLDKAIKDGLVERSNDRTFPRQYRLTDKGRINAVAAVEKAQIANAQKREKALAEQAKRSIAICAKKPTLMNRITELLINVPAGMTGGEIAIALGESPHGVGGALSSVITSGDVVRDISKRSAVRYFHFSHAPKHQREKSA